MFVKSTHFKQVCQLLLSLIVVSSQAKCNDKDYKTIAYSATGLLWLSNSSCLPEQPFMV